MEEKINPPLNGLNLNEQEMEPLFNFLRANVVRSRIPMTAVFLGINNEKKYKEENGSLEGKITRYLQTVIRQTDILVTLKSPYQWCVFLFQSKEEEGKAFLERLFYQVQQDHESLFHTYQLAFSAAIIEIRNNSVDFETLMKIGIDTIKNTIRQGDWKIVNVRDFKEIGMETIKVSIIESDEIFSRILEMSLKNLSLKHQNLEIRSFPDGYNFIQSDNWLSTSHTHLIIMNDILPMKTGFEVLHMLRQLPNNKRFFVFMMTKRNTEEDMLFAFEKGVDVYLVKPFNIHLLEAQVKGILNKLWK